MSLPPCTLANETTFVDVGRGVAIVSQSGNQAVNAIVSLDAEPGRDEQERRDDHALGHVGDVQAALPRHRGVHAAA